MAATAAARPRAAAHSEEEEECAAGADHVPSSRLDFTKLELGSLQRYHKAFKLPQDPPASSRDDLVQLIVLHFANVDVDEDEILIRFALACRRNGQRLGLGGVKKTRAGSVRPRGR